MCLSRDDLLPAGQRTHDDVVAPVLFKLYDPLSQAPVQDSDRDPSIPYRPFAQNPSQSFEDSPLLDPYLPAGHGVHSDEPVNE